MASIDEDFFRANGWLCQLIGESSLRELRKTTPTHNSVMLLPRIDAPLPGFVVALKVETAEYTNGVGREFIAVAVYLKMETSHMNLKLAAMLLVSVFMSANTSYGGDLLDRMLGRSGCSSCAAPAVECGGCGGGGLLDKLMSGCKSKCGGAGLLSVDSNAGCGCQAAAPSCGCDAAPMVEASPCGCGAAPMVEASSCGCDAAPMVESSPCGCGAAPMVEASSCGCDAAPMVEASPCGCDAAPAGKSDGLFARLRAMASGSGCGCNSAPAAASSCGCDAAPAIEATSHGYEMIAPSCGCDAAPAAGGCGSGGGFLSRLNGMASGGCGLAAPVASSCGCDAAPMVEASPCGCDAAPAGKSDGLFARLRAMTSGCGCNSAPAAASSCGCDAAPAAGGCGSGGGFLSRLNGMASGGCGLASAPVASSCGCDAAPAVQASSYEFAAPVASSCGCGSAAPSCGGGCGSAGGFAHVASRGKLTLLDRLRGNRIPRDRDGKVIGVSNDGCNPPCPTAPNTCGCSGHVESPYVIDPAPAPCSSCSTCGGGEVIYSDAMPYSEGTPVSGCASGLCGSTPTYGGAAVALPAAAGAASSEGSGSRVDPVIPPATEGDLQNVEESDRRDITQPSVSDGENDPIVDPGAFNSRPTNTMGS